MNAISGTATAEDKTYSTAEIESALTRVIGQMAELREHMKADDAEITQIKAETAALKTESAALKTESATLKAETRAIIARLESAP